MENHYPSRLLKCVVPTCGNTSKTVITAGKTGLRFFAVPRGLRGLTWVTAMGIPDMPIYGYSRVCEEHFTKADYRVVEGKGPAKKRLFKHAVPSLLLGNVNNEQEGKQSLEDVPPEDGSQQEITENEKASVEEPQCCLICAAILTEHLNPFEYHFFRGAEDMTVLNLQLWSTFVLQKIINFPNWKYEEILKRSGASIHPGSWFVMCKMCSESVLNIAKTLERIKKLELKVKNNIKEVQDKFNESLSKDSDSNHVEGIMNMGQEIRSFMKVTNANLIPKDEIEDFDEHSDEGACDEPLELEQKNDKNESERSGGEDDDDYSGTSDEEWIPCNVAEREEILALKSDSDPLAISEIDEDVDDDESDEESKDVNRRNDNRLSQISKSSLFPSRKFKCFKCPKVYSREGMLDNHLKLHERSSSLNGGLFDCYICKVPYEQINHVRNHLCEVHKLKLRRDWDGSTPMKDNIYTIGRPLPGSSVITKEFKCSICARKYNREGDYEVHRRRHELSKSLNGGLFDCFNCKVPFDNVVSLRRHLKVAHTLKLNENWNESLPQEKHAIPYLKRGSTTVDDINKDETGTYRCRMCAFKTVRKAEYVHHEEIHKASKESGNDCPKCSAPFECAQKLSNHLRFKHSEDDHCEICGSSLPKGKRGEHMVNHKIFDNCFNKETSTWTCDICQEPAINRRALSVHKVNMHHEELGIKTWKCKECPKVCPRKVDLQYHETRYHHKPTKFFCEICGYAAFTEHLLKKHMPKHSNDTYVCEYCSATYKYPTVLQAHVRQHHPDKVKPRGHYTGPDSGVLKKKAPEKKYQCKYCKKTLAHKLELKMHLDSQHKDLYIHKCDLCDKVYMSVASLQLHKKVIHLERNKAVRCKWCLKKVNHRIYLYTHAQSCKKKPANAREKIAIAAEGEGEEGTK